MKRSPFERALDEVTRDQSLVDQVLDSFDFDLAAKIIDIFATQRALARSEPPESAWRPTANELRLRAADLVLHVLKLGRENGPGSSVSGSYLTLHYSIFEDVLEDVEIGLSTVTGHGVRPLAQYVKNIRDYLDAMGGGWLDEDGRWHPGEPPEFGRPA